MAGIELKGLKEFNNIIKKLSNEFKKGFESDKKMKDTLNKVGNNIRNDIVLSMRNTRRAPWGYKRGGKIHNPSMPTNPPAVDTGELINKILWDVPKNNKLEVGTPVRYGKYLEDRDQTGLDRPWLDKTAEKRTPDLIEGISETIGQDIMAKIITSGGRKK